MKKVFVGLSGGVDSAVSAALLKDARLPDGTQAYSVTGVFIKIWRPEFTECTWKEDRIDAMRVCAALEIPFREIDLSHEYKKDIIDSMVGDYAKGITPNPDVLCNRSIKFGGFAKWAFENGADLIATGHYARVKNDGGTYRLLRGLDVNKDQSYFLHLITERDLARTLFPVGEFRKPDVRDLAKKFNLPVAEKADSQGLCFIGDISIADFLSKFLVLREGPVVDQDGKTIGKHGGAALYTVGQRHGFSTEGREPHFITRIDSASNSVFVSTRREDAAKNNARVASMHWIRKSNNALSVQTRYRETPVSISLKEDGDGIAVLFDQPHMYAPGQSLVLYDGDECLGGGAISCE